MNKAESDRLGKLRSDASRGVGWAYERLSLADLMLLLREDETLRALVRGIAAGPVAGAGSEERGAGVAGRGGTGADHGDYAPLAPVTPPAPSPMDGLREQLGAELLLLQTVRADAELAAEWLGLQASEGRQLLQLVACASQWDVLSDLWEKLANRCKQGQRAASQDELYILRSSLALHNLRWQGQQAMLADVAPGTAYDYERHQRGTSIGDSVRAQWLPGLVNAGGQLYKKPLVQT